MHWADGWPRATVAAWLRLTPRAVHKLLEAAVRKAPALAALRDRAAPDDARRPRVYHLSQLPRADRDQGRSTPTRSDRHPVFPLRV